MGGEISLQMEFHYPPPPFPPTPSFTITRAGVLMWTFAADNNNQFSAKVLFNTLWNHLEIRSFNVLKKHWKAKLAKNVINIEHKHLTNMQ